MIGSRYEETRATLIEGIRDDAISGIEKVAKQHSCYFCLMPIEGAMVEIALTRGSGKEEVKESYFLDPVCYQSAKQFPFSLN